MIKQTKIWVLIFILSQIYCQSSDLSCCQSLDNTNTICMSCTDGTFLSGNNCIVNINGCSKYSNCFTC